MTIIKTYHGADFSGNAVGPRIDPEPAILIPTHGLLALYRLKRSLAYSKINRGGTWPELVEAETAANVPEYRTQSVFIPSSSKVLAVAGAPMPSDDVTVITVSMQPEPGTNNPGGNAFLGGSIANPLAKCIGRASNSASYFLRCGSMDAAVTLPVAGGGRWEMIAGVFNKAANEVSLIRPRTATIVSAQPPGWDAPTQSFRVSMQGQAEVAVSIVYDRALSTEEIYDQIYPAVKASLSVSGIAI